MKISGMALGVIEVQPDVMPGGPLAVPEADKVLAPVNHPLGLAFAAAVATQDWHPPGHASFASAHPGRAPFETIPMPCGPEVLWPDHCVTGTPGAALAPGLDQRRRRAIIRKGMDQEIDSDSAFFANARRTATGLAGDLATIGARGLALDCVAWSAAAGLRFATVAASTA